MGKLIYASNVSLDGWTEDERGAVDWAPPDDEVFASITDLMRSVGTYLYGRRMYETMAVWETDAAPGRAVGPQGRLRRRLAGGGQGRLLHDAGRGVDANTRLERHFDPGVVHDMKTAASSDLIVGGPNLAAQAVKAGLVDECHLFVWPVVLGGGKPALTTDARVDLELLDERRFGNGVVRLRYRTL